MSEPINILVLSCGTRNKIVQYFKKELSGKGKVFATDCSSLAPALYEADNYFIVPKITEDDYLEKILQICKENKITAVLSLIDPELILIAKNKNKFLEIGTQPIVSTLKEIEASFDKFSFYKYLVEKKIKTIKSYVNKEIFYEDLKLGNVSFPAFIKPVRGSASFNINKVNSREEVEYLFEKYDNLIIQEFMDGIEIGADVYIDLINKRPVAIFTKEKIKMRAGETDKSNSLKDEKLFELIVSFIEKTDYTGVIDMDIFMVDNEYYISEVNPRFGGGYPHAHECVVNFPEMIIKNLNGEENKNIIGNYEHNIVMMKYNDVVLKRV